MFCSEELIFFFYKNKSLILSSCQENSNFAVCWEFWIIHTCFILPGNLYQEKVYTQLQIIAILFKSCFSWFQTKNWFLPWSNFWKWCLKQSLTKFYKQKYWNCTEQAQIIFRPWSLTDMICIQDVTFTPRLCNKYVGNPPFLKHKWPRSIALKHRPATC